FKFHTTAYNCKPSKPLKWSTPHDDLFKEPPPVKMLREYGAVGYVKLPKRHHRNKVSSRTSYGRLVGYDLPRKGYFVQLIAKSGKRGESIPLRDVYFLGEDVAPSHKSVLRMKYIKPPPTTRESTPSSNGGVDAADAGDDDVKYASEDAAKHAKSDSTPVPSK